MMTFRARTFWAVNVMMVWLLTNVGHAAEPWTIQITEMDPVVRHEMIWRCHINGQIPAERFKQGPYTVQVTLTQNNTEIAAQEFTLTQLGQLLTGVDVILTPAKQAGTDAPAKLTVTVTDPTRRDLQHLTRTVPTPISLQRSLEQHQRALQQSGDRDPLPALWLEQAGELILDGTTITTCQHLATIDQQLQQWRAGVHGTYTLRAFRDPIDDSIQPYRLHLPSGSPTMLAVIMADLPVIPHKSAWPTLPHPWLVAATERGCAVLEIYPAGDVAWNGVGLQRVWTAVSAARATEPPLKQTSIALIGCGNAAAGALRLAENQSDMVRALGFIDGRLPAVMTLPADPHERWLALQRPGERPAHLLSTVIAFSNCRDAAFLEWSKRLMLAGHSSLSNANTADQPEFWQALSINPTIPSQREWMILTPGTHQNIAVEELSEWGVAGSLLQDQLGNLRTVGIARLRLTAQTSTTSTLVDGKPYREPKMPPPGPRKMLDKATGPLSAYATRPFVVVIGTGESAAAQTDNQTLGVQFVTAWANHAQGRVRMVQDTDVQEDSFAGHNLILIGNSRSNLLLAKLTAKLPVQWDGRTLTIDGKSFLRSERRAFALAWPHPANDGRLMVILDGKPAWRNTGLPLEGLPDLLVGGLQTDDRPEIQRTFNNDWR
jgi:hypothetical protein